MKQNKYNWKAVGQSASELAIFGAIVVFVIGLIAQQGLSSANATNTRLRVARMALYESWKTSEGGYNKKEPSAARNPANILLIEDRLPSSVGQKFSDQDRIPYIAVGRGSFSRYLGYDFNIAQEWNLPLYDVIINGVRLPLTTAGYKTIHLDATNPKWNATTLEVPVYTREANTKSNEHWDPNCDECFDLDLDGTYPDVPAGTRENFSWQWRKLPLSEVKRNTRGDFDGDLKEEVVVGVTETVELDAGGLPVLDADGNEVVLGKVIKVLDAQDGDVDFTINDYDRALRAGQGLSPLEEPGLKNDVQMYSFTNEGTLLRIEEGKLFNPSDGQFIRSTNMTDHIDIIQRGFQLSNDTDRFCDENRLPTNWAAGSAAGVYNVAGLSNPVEACGNCFSPRNIQLTCMDEDENIIFVRSRVLNRKGSRWITRVAGNE